MTSFRVRWFLVSLTSGVIFTGGSDGTIGGSLARAQAARPSPNLGEQSTVVVEVRRWRSDLVSELRFSAAGAPGTDFDPVIDLGLPAERMFDYHFTVRLANRLRLRGNWFRVRYEADAILGADHWIDGERFTSGSTVTSFLELEQRRGGAEFDLLHGQYGFLAVAGEWAWFKAANEYSAPSTEPVSPRLEMSLPLFGLKTRIYLTPALSVTLEGLGMKRESIGVMTDFDTAITYNAIPNLAFMYGYRNSYNRFKEIEPASRAIYRLRGQYFGVIIRF